MNFFFFFIVNLYYFAKNKTSRTRCGETEVIFEFSVLDNIEPTKNIACRWKKNYFYRHVLCMFIISTAAAAAAVFVFNSLLLLLLLFFYVISYSKAQGLTM